MQMLWTAKNNSFIPEVMREQYVKNGWDLADCVSVHESVSVEFMGEPPMNKVRIAGDDGMPVWGEMPVEVIHLEFSKS